VLQGVDFIQGIEDKISLFFVGNVANNYIASLFDDAPVHVFPGAFVDFASTCKQ
jgi:hypothetical protein